MPARLIDPLFRVTNNNGVPLSGAKLYVYEAGTTNLLTTYSDSSLSIENDNPLESDSAGYFGDIFVGADDYKIHLTDADDVTIRTPDDMEIAATPTLLLTEKVNAQTGASYTIQSTDRAKLLTFSNANTISASIAQANASTFPDGWYVDVANKGVGTATITPATSTIDGLATYTLRTGETIRIVSDGTNYQIAMFGGKDPGVNAQTDTSYTVVTGDRNKLVTFSNASAIAVTLPQANSTTFKGGWSFKAACKGAGTVTITPTTSTIDGNATLELTTGESAIIVSDGTNYSTFLVNKDALALDDDDDVTFQSVTAYRPIVTETGTSKTLALTDANTFQQCSNASTQTITVPPNADVAFPIGTELEFWQEGAGTVTLAEGAGVTIRSLNSNKSTANQYLGMMIKKIGTNEWALIGDLA